ncbi:MAG: SsrA-binding protein [Sphingobacteriia bacterium]|nr:MAG: SsrA-binding protein [Sphingobacteriia bacterium]
MSFQNRSAFFHYHIEDKLVAGLVLLGTEVKSIRDGKLSFNDAFCFFDQGELWVRGLYIAEYSHGTSNNHLAVHDRKLLLNKRELKKWGEKLKDKGLTIVPLKVFFTEKGLVKMEIGLAKGKKLYDKRASIKDRESDRELKRKFG